MIQKWLPPALTAAGMLLAFWYHSSSERALAIGNAVAQEKRMVILEIKIESLRSDVRDLTYGIRSITLKGYKPEPEQPR